MFICVLCTLRTQISRSICNSAHSINNNNNEISRSISNSTLHYSVSAVVGKLCKDAQKHCVTPGGGGGFEGVSNAVQAARDKRRAAAATVTAAAGARHRRRLYAAVSALVSFSRYAGEVRLAAND
jgi:hypothetical protein